MRIATWNVNSLKVRLPKVEEWLAYARPDVLCMQETKLADSAFPALAFSTLGYESTHCGEGRWNGVAILSRVGLDDVVAGFSDQAESEVVEARLLWATCGGVRVGTVYVPNGRQVGTEHYDAKLVWLDRLRRHVETGCDPSSDLVICGDFNVAPEDRDVWDPAKLHGGTHISGARARRCRRPLRLGSVRRLPPDPPAVGRLLLVGLPCRRLPPGPRPAHRSDPGHQAPGRPGHLGHHRPSGPQGEAPLRPRTGPGRLPVSSARTEVHTSVCGGGAPVPTGVARR